MDQDGVRRIVREEVTAMGSELVGATFDAAGQLVGGFMPMLLSNVLGVFKPSGDGPGDAAVTAT